jgi:hypothetical protein
MARNEKIAIEIGAEDKASPILEKIAKKIDGLEADEARIVLRAESDKLERQLKAARDALDGLDGDEATVQARLAGNLEEALGGVQKAADKLDGSTATVEGVFKGDIDTKLKDVQKSADGSKSALANMVGNSAQDLGQLSGVAGSAGVALGQMAEYAADARLAGEGLGSVVRNFGLVAGPIAAVSAAVQVATTLWSDYKARQEETRKATADTSRAMLGQTGVLSGLIEKLREAAKIDGTPAEKFTAALTGDEDEFLKSAAALGALNKNASELGPTLIDIERNGKGALQALAEGAGVPKDLAADMALAVDATENYDSALSVLIGKGYSKELVDGYKNQLVALEELNDQQQKNNIDTIAQEQLNFAAATDEATRALVDQAYVAAGEGASALDVWTKFTDLAATASDRYRGAAGLTGVAIDGMATKVEDAAGSVESVNAEMEKLAGWLGLISDQQTNLDLADQFDAVEQAALDAYYAAASGAEDADEKQRTYQRELLKTKEELARYGVEVRGLPADVTTEIIAAYGDLTPAEIKQALDIAAGARTVPIDVILDTVKANRDLDALIAKGINLRNIILGNVNSSTTNNRPTIDQPSAGTLSVGPMAVTAGQPITNNTYITVPTANPSAVMKAAQRWGRDNGRLMQMGRG